MFQMHNDLTLTGRIATEPSYQEWAGNGDAGQPYSFGRLRLSIQDERGGLGFVTVRAYGRAAEAWAAAPLSRGMLIEVIGSLRVDEWQDGTGTRRSEVYASAAKVIILSRPVVEPDEAAVEDLTGADLGEISERDAATAVKLLARLEAGHAAPSAPEPVA